MQLTPEDIKKFQYIWKLEFGEDVPEGYARQRASTFLDLLVLLLKHEKRREADKKQTTITT